MEYKKFDLKSKYLPTGDQPSAISSLTEGVLDGLKSQVLVGVTGSGKTFTMANVIQNIQRPTLIIAHNKTLAGQLCNEFREFFPNNAVEYFVSYYDYYQPESYLPSTDTYIEKDLSINDEIDKLRHSATCSLAERSDVIVVASVSCIYGLGAPEEYYRLAVSIRPNTQMSPSQLARKLVEINYTRNDIDFQRSTFRIRGDIVDIFPASNSETCIRVEFFGDEIDSVSEVEYVTGNKINNLKHAVIFPASHYAVENEKLKNCLTAITKDMQDEVQAFRDGGKILEAERLLQRTSYDIEMMNEIGYCSGIENYSRYFDGRKIGEPPFTLIDYFPKNFLLFIDESHMTIPQLHAMYNGDKARKTNLVDYGFRLKSAFDNRPLKFEEFEDKIGQVIFVSATPGKYELNLADNITEQIIRPTGLLDPQIEVRKTLGQIDDIESEVNKTIQNGGRILITTLTKKMAEELSKFLKERGYKCRYMHSDIDTLERFDIISDLRKGESDILVGINLLREGLDMPEVQLVIILDADKEGFLRSDTALIQTIGRTARNSQGRVIMYADTITDSMHRAIDETNRRRKIQQEYNKEHNIVPKTIIKDVVNTLNITSKHDKVKDIDYKDIPEEIEKLTALLKIASKNYEFEKCIELRDTINSLKKKMRK